MGPPEGPSTTQGSRPPTRLSTALNVSGGAPPSASGPRTAGPTASSSGRAASGARTGKTGSRTADGSSTVAALAAELIKSMRVKFGDCANNVKGQEIIANEVMALVNQAGKLQEDDLAALQERIRGRLMGSTPVKNTMSREKRSQVDGDEWAKIFEYHIQRGNLEDQRVLEIARDKQRRMKEMLQLQIKERKERERQEHEKEVLYFQSEQQSLKEWELQEAARKQLQMDIVTKLKEERNTQLIDKSTRRQMAVTKRNDEEVTLARKIAYETKTEYEREEAARQHAKEALKDFLSENENNKKLREIARARECEQDLEFKRQWEAQLDKQELERTSRLERLKVIQDQQAETAKSRPEAKKWLDQAVIDKYYKEHENARELEEQRRKAKVRASAERVKDTLAEQIKEREHLRELQRQADEEKGRALLAKVAADEAKEQARKQKELDKKLKFRADLEAQMQENAHRRRVAPMSKTEKLINTQLLEQVQHFEASGKVLLPPV